MPSRTDAQTGAKPGATARCENPPRDSDPDAGRHASRRAPTTRGRPPRYAVDDAPPPASGSIALSFAVVRRK